jgi:hypothetical protein
VLIEAFLLIASKVAIARNLGELSPHISLSISQLTRRECLVLGGTCDYTGTWPRKGYGKPT